MRKQKQMKINVKMLNLKKKHTTKIGKHPHKRRSFSPKKGKKKCFPQNLQSAAEAVNKPSRLYFYPHY